VLGAGLVVFGSESLDIRGAQLTHRPSLRTTTQQHTKLEHFLGCLLCNTSQLLSAGFLNYPLVSNTYCVFVFEPYPTMSLPDVDHSRRNPKPRLLLENERVRLDEFIESIGYSAR